MENEIIKIHLANVYLHNKSFSSSRRQNYTHFASKIKINKMKENKKVKIN